MAAPAIPDLDRDGAGYRTTKGSPLYFTEDNCPLHDPGIVPDERRCGTTARSHPGNGYP